jgi:hypothetical protein
LQNRSVLSSKIGDYDRVILTFAAFVLFSWAVDPKSHLYTQFFDAPLKVLNLVDTESSKKFFLQDSSEIAPWAMCRGSRSAGADSTRSQVSLFGAMSANKTSNFSFLTRCW